ncbi:MAG TPA: 6-phosphogluconolactonase, partial [Gemmatimonadota bacterium]|nr:6-phosphogluconolactonase [Gemmatimonadota bacterium]
MKIETPARPSRVTAIQEVPGSRERERIRTVIVEDPHDLAVLVAGRMVEVIQHETEAKGHCVLGLATGSTPIGVYRDLIRRYANGEVDFSKVITFNLDEYYPMSPYSIHSYRLFMMENFFSQVNLDPRNIHIPDGSVPRDDLASHCRAFEDAIRDAGGIDFQILGIGRSGHIGFN